MTPQEFKAWFDGFIEAFDRPPTAKQWTRIKARVAEIDGRPTTHTVYVDRYNPWIYTSRLYPLTAANYATNTMDASSICSPIATTNATLSAPKEFDSMSAMNHLGRAEALSVQ